MFQAPFSGPNYLSRVQILRYSLTNIHYDCPIRLGLFMTFWKSKTSIFWFLATCSVLAVSGCSKLGASPENTPPLMERAAPCAASADFANCLLAAYANHPASLAFPEGPELSLVYGNMIASGYDRELRRKTMNKGLKDHHKNNNTKLFQTNDMYFHALNKTADGTEQALKLLAADESAGLQHLDFIMERFLDRDRSFDPKFSRALINHYSERWMQKSAIWDQTGMVIGRAPDEILSAAYKKLGDLSAADKQLAELKTRRFYKLRQTLKPVLTGRSKASRFNGAELKAAGFSAMAIKPWFDQKMTQNASPKLILTELAFAIRHGHADNVGDELVRDALSYALRKNDISAIKSFADQILKISEDPSNGMGTVLKRADRLSQDLVLVEFLAAIGDQNRINKVSHKWDHLSKPLPDGRLPGTTGTSTPDYTMIMHHANRTDELNTYIAANKDRLIRLDQKAEYTLSRVSRAVTVKKLKELEPDLKQASAEYQKSFYTLCAHQSGVAQHTYDVRMACADKIQSPDRRINARMRIAQKLYKDGDIPRGRKLAKEALSEIQACQCADTRPFSYSANYLADIIALEFGGKLY